MRIYRHSSRNVSVLRGVFVRQAIAKDFLSIRNFFFGCSSLSMGIFKLNLNRFFHSLRSVDQAKSYIIVSRNSKDDP